MAPNAEIDQPSRPILLPRSDLDRDLQEFLIDRQARNVSPKTLRWYEQSLSILREFLRSQDVTATRDVSPATLRRFLLHLRERGHNDGGVRNIWGAVKAYLRWYETEADGWVSPLHKVATPRTPERRMEPVSLEDVRRLLATCERRTYHGERDRAVILALLDTGCRASEFLALDVGDVTMTTGAVLIREGKGRKPRVSFVGAQSRRAIGRYLRHRRDLVDSSPLWATAYGDRLTYGGLRQVMRRRAGWAGIKTPSLHSFRHAFALACLRGGVDLVSLQRLLGHADLSVLRRYLAQTEEDLRRAHELGGPVDRLL